MGLDDRTSNLHRRREGDDFLTALFLKAGFNEGSLRRLNRCRLYLRILTVADIVTANGAKITTAGWNGIRDSPHYPQYAWPTQG